MADLNSIINGIKNMSMKEGPSERTIKDKQRLVVNIASLLTKKGDKLFDDLANLNRLKSELGTSKGIYDELVQAYEKAYTNEDWYLAFKIWIIVTRRRQDLEGRHYRLVTAYKFIETDYDLQDSLLNLVDELVKAGAYVPKIAASYVTFEHRKPRLGEWYSNGSNFWSRYTFERMEYDIRAWLGRHAADIQLQYLGKFDGWRVPGGVHFPFYNHKEPGCASGNWTESDESFKLGAKFVAPDPPPQFRSRGDRSMPLPSPDVPRVPHTESAQALVDEWRDRCAPVLENRHSTLTEFPKPPIFYVCGRPACLAKESSRALACACVIRSAFNRVKDFNPAKERLKWHPDRFAGCEKTEEFQRYATEIFPILQAIHEERQRQA